MVFQVADSIFKQAESFPSRVALIDSEGALTFGELVAQVKLFSNKLKQVEKQQLVIFQAPNNRQFVIQLLSILSMDAVALPISESATTAQLDQLISELKPRAIIREADVLLLQGEGSALLKKYDTPAVIRFTSGTTGRSKGVVISHQAIEERNAAAFFGLKLKQSDIVLFALPMAYHFVVSLLLYLRYGVTFAIPKDNSISAIDEILKKSDANIIYGTPSLYQAILPLNSLNKIERAFSTSTGISKDLAKKFHDKFKIPVTQIYGLIEVGLPIANLDYSENVSQNSVGKVLPGYQVKVVDAEGLELKNGELGRLAIKGPGMFQGYLMPTDSKKDVLDNGWFYSGDQASISDEGDVTIYGREHSVINLSGTKIFPEEIEEVIAEIPGIKKVKVSEKEDSLGNFIVAEIVTETEGILDKQSIKAVCEMKLEKIKIPEQIYFVQDIPTTQTGKIARSKESSI